MKKLFVVLFVVLLFMVAFQAAGLDLRPPSIRSGPFGGYWVWLRDSGPCPSGYVGSAGREGYRPETVVPSTTESLVVAKVGNGNVFSGPSPDLSLDGKAWNCTLYIKLKVESGFAHVARVFFDEKSGQLLPLWNWTGYVRDSDLIVSGTLGEISQKFQENFSK